MEINILGTQVVLNDDPQLEGICLTIFFCGCHHKCFNCQNVRSWDAQNGKLVNITEIKEKIKNSRKLITSVCFCGGEPILQEEAVIKLTSTCKEYGLKTILYTGYEFEKLSDDIRNLIDIIIDGKYIDEQFQIGFPASANQRIFLNGVLTDPKTLSINQGGV